MLEARTITSVAATSLSERLDHNRQYQDRVMINYAEGRNKYSFVFSNLVVVHVGPMRVVNLFFDIQAFLPSPLARGIVAKYSQMYVCK